MLIKYYIGAQEYASRTRDHVPREGDVIRFKSVCFKIKEVVWIEDTTPNHVAICISKIIN